MIFARSLLAPATALPTMTQHMRTTMALTSAVASSKVAIAQATTAASNLAIVAQDLSIVPPETLTVLRVSAFLARGALYDFAARLLDNGDDDEDEDDDGDDTTSANCSCCCSCNSNASATSASATSSDCALLQTGVITTDVASQQEPRPTLQKAVVPRAVAKQKLVVDPLTVTYWAALMMKMDALGPVGFDAVFRLVLCLHSMNHGRGFELARDSAILDVVVSALQWFDYDVARAHRHLTKFWVRRYTTYDAALLWQGSASTQKRRDSLTRFYSKLPVRHVAVSASGVVSASTTICL